MSTPDEPDVVRTSPTVDELQAIQRRAGWTASRAVGAVPLMSWGAAWGLGYPALAFLPFTAAVAVGVVLALGAGIATVVVRPHDIRRGIEQPLGLAWAALLLGSAGLLAIVEPLPLARAVLLLGALWGLALVALGLALADRSVALVGTAIVVLAVLGRIVSALGDAGSLAAFGILSGGAMLGLGLSRMRRPA